VAKHTPEATLYMCSTAAASPPCLGTVQWLFEAGLRNNVSIHLNHDLSRSVDTASQVPTASLNDDYERMTILGHAFSLATLLVDCAARETLDRTPHQLYIGLLTNKTAIMKSRCMHGRWTTLFHHA